jgi:U3 small nucleolar RNA-associated protein 16
MHSRLANWIRTIANMVTTRGGADTSSIQASSPATLKPLKKQKKPPAQPEPFQASSPPTLKAQKKRPAEPEQDHEHESPSLTKRKKFNAAGNTRNKSATISEKIAIRPHLEEEPPTASSGAPNTALPVRSHVRFNSASPPPAPAIVHTQPEAKVEEEEESDDDAAPEEVSLSAAKAQSHAVKEQTEQIKKELSESAKRKRRRRDAQLKAQAAGSTKRTEKKKKIAVVEAALENEDEEVKQQDDEPLAEKKQDDEQVVEKKKKSKKRKETADDSNKLDYSPDNIPDLLPAELLATEAPVRSPTSFFPSKPVESTNLKTHEPFAALKIPRQSAPKDLEYGNVKVRVLDQKNLLLPPKVTSRSKSIRDTWLKGRSQFEKTTSRRNTGGKLQRRPMGSTSKAFV